MITPNSYTVYPCPTNYREMFIHDGRRYFQTFTMYLISEYGQHGFLPPLGRGSYIKISAKEFKEKKSLYESAKKDYELSQMGYLNKGVEKIQNTLF